MKKTNHGKAFEEDFKKSAEQCMWVYRLRDPAVSFNQDNNSLRFSWRNIADFIMFKSPSLYLIECKGHKGASIPFNALKNKKSDHRIKDMAKADAENQNLNAFVVFNWREHGNKTVAVNAGDVHLYIESEGEAFGEGPRKSIPLSWTIERGRCIKHKLKRKRYNYFIDKFINSLTDPINLL